MIVAWLAFFDSLLALAMIAAGIFGAHYHYATPFTGFQMFLLGFLMGIVAVILGVIGIFATRSPIRAPARPRAVVGTVIGLLIITPILWKMFAGPRFPPINDITTDFDNPPEFTHAEQLNANRGRDMKYDRAKYADRQLAGYGPLNPLKMPEPPDDAFKVAQKIAAQMPDWTITNVDATDHTIEGYATSGLFHFNDDFIIQVRPGPDGGSVLEMRSKSRDGIGDFGVNHKRIEDYFAAVSPGSAS